MRGAQLQAVVVGEAHGELPACGHRLDGWEEEVIVREAEVRGERGVETLDAGVEALGEQLELVRLG